MTLVSSDLSQIYHHAARHNRDNPALIEYLDDRDCGDRHCVPWQQDKVRSGYQILRRLVTATLCLVVAVVLAACGQAPESDLLAAEEKWSATGTDAPPRLIVCG